MQSLQAIHFHERILLTITILACLSQPAAAVLITTHVNGSRTNAAVVDGVITTGEYTLSRHRRRYRIRRPVRQGTLYFESDATRTYVGGSIARRYLGDGQRL